MQIILKFSQDLRSLLQFQSHASYLAYITLCYLFLEIRGLTQLSFYINEEDPPMHFLANYPKSQATVAHHSLFSYC